MQNSEIKNKAIRGVIALTWRTIFLQAISFGAFFALGIFLSPSAIGVFIGVSALMRVFSLFTDIGLGAALIQKHDDLDDLDLSTTFSLQTILVGSVVFLGLALTKWVANFSGFDRDAMFLYQVLLVTLLISSFKVIPSILLERKLAFEKQIIPQIVESLVFNGVIVLLAYKGYGVAAYSWSILLSSVVGLPIYYLVSFWKPTFAIDWMRAKKLVSFGLSYQGKSVLAVLKDDLLTFFMTGFVGTSGIGYWGWAQRWAYSPYRFLVDSITKVTFPAYARVQNDSEKLKSGVEKSLFAISTLLFPIFTLMILVIPNVIEILPRYSKWLPALPSFYFLCLGAAISSLNGVLITALDAIGKVKITLRLMILWIVLIWISTLISVKYFGFTGIALASFIVSLTIVITVWIVKKQFNFSFYKIIFPPIVACVFMYFLSFEFIRVSLPVYNILAKLLFGSVIYLSLILLISGRQIIAIAKTIILAYKK